MNAGGSRASRWNAGNGWVTWDAKRRPNSINQATIKGWLLRSGDCPSNRGSLKWQVRGNLFNNIPPTVLVSIRLSDTFGVRFSLQGSHARPRQSMVGALSRGNASVQVGRLLSWSGFKSHHQPPYTLLIPLTSPLLSQHPILILWEFKVVTM